MFLLIVLNRLNSRIEPILSEKQAGFRSDRSKVQQMLTLRLIEEKHTAKQRKYVYNCFIDFKKAFDSVQHDLIWGVLESYGVDNGLLEVLKSVYQSAEAAVRVGSEEGEWFKQEKGVRQGDPISPCLFAIYLERTMERTQESMLGLKVHGHTINNLKFADDIDLIKKNWIQLQESLNMIIADALDYGFKINTSKTKVMVFGTNSTNRNIKLNGEDIETVDNFVYL